MSVVDELTAILAYRRRRSANTADDVTITTVAMQLVGGAWYVDDANADTPDAFITDGGGFAQLDTSASSGLSLSIVSAPGQIQVA